MFLLSAPWGVGCGTAISADRPSEGSGRGGGCEGGVVGGEALMVEILSMRGRTSPALESKAETVLREH
jgi:hypothetical protein